jgi:KDO2-lipid IV(A) lauroyltransferase
MVEAEAKRCRFVAPANLLAALVARLPQRLLLALGAALSWLLRPLLRKRRRIARTNLALCFPELDEASRERLLKANVRATVTGMLELLRAWFAPSRALRGLADVEGVEHLREARRQGRGVMLLSGHFPSTQLGLRFLLEHWDGRATVMARRYGRPCLERFLERARRRVFDPTIGKKGGRALLDALSAGGVVLYSADQDFNFQNAFVPFFGIPASTLTAPPSLARRANAVVLPFWFQRKADGRYSLRIEPQWDGWPSDDPVADAARYMAELEKVVRLHPEQYVWMHRRFKTRPAGAADVYRKTR